MLAGPGTAKRKDTPDSHVCTLDPQKCFIMSYPSDDQMKLTYSICTSGVQGTPRAQKVFGSLCPFESVMFRLIHLERLHASSTYEADDLSDVAACQRCDDLQWNVKL